VTDARAAFDPDRLPWLPDERARVASRRRQPSLLLLGLLGLLLVAAASYFAGVRSRQPDPLPSAPAPAPVVTQALQPPQPAPFPPVVEPAPPPPAPEVEPATMPPAMVQRAPLARREAAPPPARVAEPEAAEPSPPRPAPIQRQQQPVERQPAARTPARLQAWPADISQGASGRVVRIGTFATRLQAKRAWSKVVRVYPGMRRLRAVVAPVPSLRNGRTYYRLQFGTTSQAHSAVLCQRMRIVGQSCVVVGL
jgi:hypothetical protein